MRHTARRRLVSVIALLLALSIVLGLVTAAFAAEPEARKFTLGDANGDGVIHYVSMGGSNAGGYGLNEYLTKDEILELNGDTLQWTDARLSGYDRNAPESYSGRIAAWLKQQNPEIPVTHQSLAIREARSQEFRLLLDAAFSGDSYTAKHFAEGWLQGLREDALASVKQADLITLDLGWNDFGFYVCDNLIHYLKTGESLYDHNLTKILGEDNKAVADGIIAGIRSQVDPILAGLSDSQIQVVSETFAYALVGYIMNLDVILGKIYLTNPQAQVLIPGIQNQLTGMQAEDQTLGLLPLDAMYAELVNMANVYLQQYSPYRDKYLFTMVGADGHVTTFLEEVAAYAGDPAGLSAAVKTGFDVYDESLGVKKIVTKAFSETYAQQLQAAEQTAEMLIAAGEAGKLEDEALKALYESYTAALQAAYHAAAQAVQYVAKNCSTVSTSAISGDVIAAQTAVEKFLADTVRNAAKKTMAGETYAPDFTLLDESVHTLAAAAVVRAFFGKGFFSHPNSQGHQQITNDLLACAKGEGVKAAQLILLENGLKQILAAIDCTKIGHISDVAWSWTGDYSAAQVKQICLRCDAAEPADAVVTKEIIPSTCSEAGKTVYTAKATLAGKELTDVRETALPLLPHEVEAVDEVEATCDKPGNKAHFACKVCGNLFADADGKTQVKAEDVVVTLPHDLEAVAAEEATCGKPGNKAHYLCKVCGGLFADEAGKTALKAEDVILTKSHTLQEAAAVEPDCTTTGLKAHYKCSFCGKYFADAEAKQELKPEELVLPALGHQYGAPVWTWADDYSKATVETKCVCGLAESAEAEITIKTVDYTCTENGSITYTAAAKLRDQDVTDSKVITLDAAHHYTDGICTVCGDDINEYRVFRVFGSNRYKTAFKVANEMKEVLGIEKFESVVVASGTEFADALAGSYLAIRKNAPILLVRREYIPNVKDYIRQNVKTGGDVYILGGENAISMSMDLGLEGYQVKRLQGSNRYMTNLEILKEAKISEDEKEILVCTGKNFADSLSASALGKPILLVRDTLYEAQKEYLKSLGEGYRLVIIGGEKAVSASLEKELSAYGEIERLDGANRYETSTLLATRFLRDAEPEAAVLAYALNFPDGLCGGPLANALGGPLLLTHDVRSQDAIEYAREAGINYGYVLGGNGLVGDVATMDIFATDKIKVKN